jgi:hypothetical protein
VPLLRFGQAAIGSAIVKFTVKFRMHVYCCHAVQLGMGKERLLRLFHPDALDLLNTTNDLARVCADLADPNTHIMRKVTDFAIFLLLVSL